MVELIIVILILIVLFIYFKSKSEQLTNEKATGDVNYLKLYEDFDYNNLLYEMNGSGHVKYAIRAGVRSVDINIPGTGYVELWNVRPNNVLASTLSDTYENTIYTTPSRLRDVTGKLELIARVNSGERFKSTDLPRIKKILIVADF